MRERGAALLSVIIISAIAIILATTVSVMAYSSYRSRLIRQNSENNFYRCENVLDQIRVGIRNDMTIFGENSVSDRQTFNSLFDKYVYKDSNGNILHAQSTSSPQTQGVCSLRIILDLVDSLNSKTITSKKYNYIGGKSYPTQAVLSAGDCVATITVPEDKNSLFLYDDCVYIKDITVKLQYLDYTNSITTDIRIGYLGEGESANVSEKLCDFSIVSFGGLKVCGQNAGTLIVYGNMYLEAADSLYDEDPVGLFVDGNVSNGTIGFIGAGSLIIINGDLVAKNGAIIRFPENSRIYVNGNVSVDAASTLELEKSTLFVTATDMAGNAHTLDYTDYNSNIDETQVLSIACEEFPDYSPSDFLAQGEIKNIDGVDYMIGLNNSALFGSNLSGNIYTADDMAGIGLTDATHLSLSGLNKAGIYIFRNDRAMTEASTFAQTFQGLLITRNLLTISPLQKVYDNVYKVNASVLKPPGEEIYQRIVGADGLSLNLSLVPQGSDGGAQGVSIPAGYLFNNDGDVTVKITGSARGTSAMTKSTALSISYKNWSRN